MEYSFPLRFAGGTGRWIEHSDYIGGGAGKGNEIIKGFIYLIGLSPNVLLSINFQILRKFFINFLRKYSNIGEKHLEKIYRNLGI